MFKRFEMSGFFAWLMWLGIHLTFLVGFRNRIAVLFNWAYVYFTYRRHAQIIVGEPPKPSATPAVLSSPLPEPQASARERAAQPEQRIH